MNDLTQKPCNVCRKTLPVDAFYRDSSRITGYFYRCKPCDKGVRRNSSAYRAKQKREKLKYPEKALARALLHVAIKKGVVVRPVNCEACKQTRKVYGHHPDYSKPLEVVWLCSVCHYAIHHMKEAA